MERRESMSRARKRPGFTCLVAVSLAAMSVEASAGMGKYVRCSGDYDQAPEVVRDADAIFPPAIHPARIEDLQIRRMREWDVETTFDVGVDGVPVNPRSSATNPKEFGQAANSSVLRLKFSPAMREGQPVTASCEVQIYYAI